MSVIRIGSLTEEELQTLRRYASIDICVWINDEELDQALMRLEKAIIYHPMSDDDRQVLLSLFRNLNVAKI